MQLCKCSSWHTCMYAIHAMLHSMVNLCTAVGGTPPRVGRDLQVHVDLLPHQRLHISRPVLVR